MLMLFPLCFYLYVALKDKISTWETLVAFCFWACPILTILGASSRGAQLALAVQLILMFGKNIFRIKTMIAIAAFSILLFNLLPEEQKARFTESGEDKTSMQRLLYWEHGWEMMKDYPFTGVGFFNFIPYYEQHHREDMLYPRAQLPQIYLFRSVQMQALSLSLSLFY
ncbi:MAG: O-antigen ligase family protein [Cellvibrio sp.]|nr:O-antigen ligase family protein [Cellvibrio sp.]